MTDDTDKSIETPEADEPTGTEKVDEEPSDEEGWGEAAADAGWDAGAEPAAKSAMAADERPDLAPAPAAPWDSTTPEIYSTEPDEPEPLPSRHRHEDLRSAVGVDSETTRSTGAGKKPKSKRTKKREARKRPAKRHDEYNYSGNGDDGNSGRSGGKRRRVSTRTAVIAIVIGLLAVTIAGLVVLGNFNSRHYYLVCGADEISAERGKSFPPWGSESLSGKQWTPIKIPAKAECEAQKFTDPEELEKTFSKALFEQAEARLLAGGTENVEVAAQQLEQALLLLRNPNRSDRRKKIVRLQGDVEYAHALSRARQAAATLKEAAEGFDKAHKKVPRHTRDAATWSEFVRKLQKMIEIGPKSLDGVAIPSGESGEPTTTTSGPPEHIRDAGPGPVDAEPGVALPPTADAPPAPIDAGLPSGGVLL